jgi:hypothetical protein
LAEGDARTAILIRTHFGDEMAGKMAAWLATGRYDVYVVADETLGVVDAGATPKISLTPRVLTALGLFASVPRPCWRCGDYALIAARGALPQYARFWMVETDVRLNSRRPQEFFDRFEASNADFLAANLEPAPEAWDWRATMDPSLGAVWRSLFPLVRLSAGAIDAIGNGRRVLTQWATQNNRDWRTWPNDEVFTASVLKRRYFDCRDLNELGDVYVKETFRFWWAISERDFAKVAPDDRAYHPVLSGEAYFAKLLKLAMSSERYDALEEAVRNLTGVEWSAEDAERYLAIIAHTRTQPMQPINRVT